MKKITMISLIFSLLITAALSMTAYLFYVQSNQIKNNQLDIETLTSKIADYHRAYVILIRKINGLTETVISMNDFILELHSPREVGGFYEDGVWHNIGETASPGITVDGTDDCTSCEDAEYRIRIKNDKDEKWHEL